MINARPPDVFPAPFSPDLITCIGSIPKKKTDEYRNNKQ
jgi:hypothetical protein